MLKNVANQIISVRAWKNGAPFAADASQITAIISLDGAAAVATNDVNPSLVTNMVGQFIFNLTQAETNANHISLEPSITETDVTLTPVELYTEPVALTAAQIRAELATELGRIDTSISSRLASSAYTGPDNLSISKILAFVEELLACFKADCYIDKTTTPWSRVIHEKGNPSNVYLRKALYGGPDDSGVASTNTIITKHVNVEVGE